MKTTIRTFYFDTKNPAEAKAWAKFRAERMAETPHRMKSWGGIGHYHFVKALDGAEIELETAHLFENQWNTAPIAGISDKGLRVFDWAQDYMDAHQAHIKRGHWLEQTAEMREVRRNTNACGYCGYQEAAAKGSVFCPRCIDSEYLTEKELHLTRMRSVDTPFNEGRRPLSEGERDHLLPLYRHAQLHGSTERGKKRIAEERARLQRDYEARIRNATTERDGFLWFMDRGINTENLIYYSHTGRFCFGWRQPVSADFRAALLEIISEFPFAYDIKSEGGKVESAA